MPIFLVCLLFRYGRRWRAQDVSGGGLRLRFKEDEAVAPRCFRRRNGIPNIGQRVDAAGPEQRRQIRGELDRGADSLFHRLRPSPALV